MRPLVENTAVLLKSCKGLKLFSASLNPFSTKVVQLPPSLKDIGGKVELSFASDSVPYTLYS
jgi:hypothetical protein